MSKEDGGPAFPIEIRNTTDEVFIGCLGEEVKPNSFAIYTGLSVRDYFAAKALQGILAAMDSGERNYTPHGTTAGNAYLLADAMLAARVKP